MNSFYKFSKHLLLAAIGLFLASCAGQHCVPEPHYFNSSKKCDNTTRVAFDQDGHIYPKSTEFTRPELGPHWGKAFRLEPYLKGQKFPYSCEIRTKLSKEVAAEVTKELRRTGSKDLYILIHGYNNSYSQAEENFVALKKAINAKNAHYLEVYWDGLYKGKSTFWFPILYWFDALTYSNLAGQAGLRQVIKHLPSNLNLTFVTHSRGAGVAYSTIANPEYSSHIEREHEEPIDMKRFNSVKLKCFAPAIGNGHPLNRLAKNLPEDASMTISHKPFDMALNKWIFLGHKFGDCSLGCSRSTQKAQADLANQERPNLLNVVDYDFVFGHGLKSYLKRTKSTEKLLNTKSSAE